RLASSAERAGPPSACRPPVPAGPASRIGWAAGAAAASRGPASPAEWALARALEPQARPAAIPATTRTRTRLATGPRVDFLVMASSDSVVLEGIRDSPDGCHQVCADPPTSR